MLCDHCGQSFSERELNEHRQQLQIRELLAFWLVNGGKPDNKKPAQGEDDAKKKKETA